MAPKLPYRKKHQGTQNFQTVVIDRDLYVYGNIFFGDAALDELTINGILKFGAASTIEGVMSWADATDAKIFETGTYASTASSGVNISSTNNRPISFLFDDAGTAMTGDIRGALSRIYLSVDQNSGVTLNALRGQIKLADDKDLDNINNVISPITGYFEFAGTANRTVTGHTSCVRAALEDGASGTTTVSASSYLSGFEATLNSSRTYTETGDMAAFLINTSTGTSKWPNGLFMADGSVDTGIDIGTCTDGINIVGATELGVKVSMPVLTAGDSYSGIRSAVVSEAPNNSYGAAGYFDTTITGTQAGTFLYGLGSWINASATLDSTNDYVCAQDNGLYVNDSATLAGARMVFGLRMECLIGAGSSGITHGEYVFPFSLNTQNNGITALFECMTATDLGTITNAGGATGEVVPLFRDNGGNMRYIKIWTAV